MVRLATRVGAGGTTLLSVTDMGYTYYNDGRRERLLASGLDKAAVADVNLDCFVKRPGISRTISSVLQHVVGNNCYHLIIGHSGTGKTNLVSNVSNKLWGIIYVDILHRAISKKRFADLLGTALKWTTPGPHWVAVMLGIIGITQENIHGADLF